MEAGRLVGRLELRLGNDPRALDYAQRSVAACHRCPEVTGAAVRVALGSERFDLAERWLRRLEPQLPGPAAHQARDRVRRVEHLSKLRRQAEGNLRLSLEAQRLALLELWGRAWRLLQPHRLAIISSGLESTVTLAELAFRSGDEAAARRLLQTHLGSAQIDRQMGRWRAGNRQVSPP